MSTYIHISPYADPFTYGMTIIPNEEGIPQAEEVTEYPRIPFDDAEQTFVPKYEEKLFDSLKLELGK